MLIGLLSVRGMRPGEALNLKLQDVDLKHCFLTVRGSKFGKSRWVVTGHLEKERHNSIRTLNASFIAIRSFMQYAALKEPSALGLIQSVLAIPMKRFERPLVGLLPQDRVRAILEVPPLAGARKTKEQTFYSEAHCGWAWKMVSDCHDTCLRSVSVLE